MYIAPNTVVKILKDVPLDEEYDHSLYFANIPAQSSYFNTKVKYTLNAHSYQRVKRGYMRVNIQYENLYDCNYIMFQNSSFGNKWFYAFLKSAEYINNAVSEIEFEIDVMQTWFFDFQLEQCMVEREHSFTDAIGENIVPESLQLGEYVIKNFANISYPYGNTYKCVVAATFLATYNTPLNPGEWYFQENRCGIDCKTFSGLTLNAFSINNQNDINYLNSFFDAVDSAGKTEGIINVYMVPEPWAGAGWPINEINPQYTRLVAEYNTLDGYTPKNNKLYTYPYHFIYGTNYNGAGVAYPFEFFTHVQGDSDNYIYFKNFCTSCQSPELISVPLYYKGVTENYDEMLKVSGFPVCAWNSDIYKAWSAQVGAALPYDIIDTGIDAGVMGFSGNPGGAGLSVFSKVTGLLRESAKARIKPLQAHGSQNTSTLWAVDKLRVEYFKKTITAQMARTIDDYFTIYGYATKRVKTPNINARPHWTFTKTVGCKIIGSLPADDQKKICDIFDKGVTFWKNPSEVGNYYLDNRPGA